MKELFKGIHILVIEDIDNIRNILTEIFEKRGFVVLQARDWCDAIDKASVDKPDLIVIDLLPFFDGAEICRHLRSNAVTKDIPIIFYSSQHNVVKDFVRNLPGAPVDYVEDLYGILPLLEKIKEFIEKK